jgi:hypothetical protein
MGMCLNEALRMDPLNSPIDLVLMETTDIGGIRIK